MSKPPVPVKYSPSELATTQGSFVKWADTALVETLPYDNRYKGAPSESRKVIDALTHLKLPKVLKERLVSARNDNGEESMIRDFARDLLNGFEGSFTSDTDDYSLEHEWRKLATGHQGFLFALTAPHPSVNEATTRCGVDFLLHQVVRVAGEKQEPGGVGYQHEVSTAMSKTYTEIPFHVSHELKCSGQTTYRLPSADRLAIRSFGNLNNVSTEVMSAAHLSLNCDDLCMVVIEYMKNDPTAALQRLLMDFAAILRHRRFLGFGLGYLLGIIGSHKGHSFYTLSFYLGTLTDEGHVRHWFIDTLNLASPAEMLRSYVWMINGLSSFIAYAETWTFESSAPRHLPKLSWRADCQDFQRLGQVKGSGGSHKRKRTNSQGRRSSDGGYETSDGNADNYMRMDKTNASGSGAEPEENSSEELMDNDYGQRMITMVDEDGIPYKIPHYTPSELARCVDEDEEFDEEAVEARERIHAQQGEISSDDKTQRYLASLRMDGGARFLADSV